MATKIRMRLCERFFKLTRIGPQIRRIQHIPADTGKQQIIEVNILLQCNMIYQQGKLNPPINKQHFSETLIQSDLILM